MSCSDGLWPLVSRVNGVASFALSFVSLFPQIIETFRDKSVAGLSPLFLLAWVCGDITSLVGAIMTKQLLFQVVLAVYFLLNDLFVCGQYYYYGIIHGNKLATAGHEAKRLSSSSAVDSESLHANHSGFGFGFSRALASLSALLSSSNALPLATFDSDVPQPPPAFPAPGSPWGTTLSWIGAAFYVGARIPQLVKNYTRKSTDGVSPFLFGTTLLCNLTYNLSIVTSCDFIESNDKSAFLWNAAPFIAGSAGTVAFDLLYFYQHYVLYGEDLRLREQESRQSQSFGQEESEECSPLLDQRSHENHFSL